MVREPRSKADLCQQRLLRFSFGLRGLLLSITLCAVALGCWSWSTRWPNIRIAGADIRSEKTFKVKADLSSYLTFAVPISLTVQIDGSLDGQAMMTDPWGKSAIIGPGPFSVSLKGEYTQEEASFTYLSKGATHGSVTVRYRFEGIEP